ncbi:MAG: methyltransferase domain-containing protein [Gluconacetobacter diazotrophicus]|nr:methyltransferase domain-containing protein [Gluconacetobacter diazotrophicus]
MFPREFDPAQPELMDRPQPVTRELEVDLANLVGINRYFGSHRLIRGFLRRWFRPGESYRVLDLCTASGDIPRLMVDWARTRGVHLQIEAVDYQASTLAVARRLSAGYPEIVYREGDALAVGGGAGEYDFVFCSLALHHFAEEGAVILLRRARELARRGVLVADLERSRPAQAGVWLLTAVLYREPMTQQDARVSVRRAFSYRELAALARRAGWEHFGHRRFPVARQAIWTGS